MSDTPPADAPSPPAPVLRPLAHDLNNRLMVVAGNVELLRSRLAAAGPIPEELADIAEATTDAVAIARQILAAARRLEPRTAEGTVTPTAATPTPAAPTVLVVDDEVTVRATVRRILERAGYAVVEAGDGREALARLAPGASQPAIALVLSDVVMPVMSAAPLVRRLAAERPDLPVLLMSGYTAENAPPDSFPDGATDVLLKPFTPEALLERVRVALGNPSPGGR